jgi:cell division protein FtsL
MEYVSGKVSDFSAVKRQPIAKRSVEVRRRYVRQVVMLLAIALGFALLFVWTRVQVIQLGYEVSRMRKETKSLADQKNILEADIAGLLAPERLEKIAIEKFGMRLPLGDEIVVVPKQEVNVNAKISDGRNQQ